MSETESGARELARLLASRDLAQLAAHWSNGADIDWTALATPARPQLLELPTYPFARDRHWLPTTPKTAAPPAALLRPTRPAETTVDDLHVLGRTWRPVSAPQTTTSAPTLLILAPTPALSEAIAAAWPGPHRHATPAEAATLIDNAQTPLAIANAMDWETDNGLLPTFALARALHARNLDGASLLHIHRQDAPRPLAAAIAAFARAAAIEVPGIQLRAITVQNAASPATLARIIRAEALANDAAPEILYRNEQRHLPTMTRLPTKGAPDPAIPFRVSGAYLLAGGLGDLGCALAERLMRRYHARIAIIGRRPAIGPVAERLAALRAIGDVHYERADIADPRTLEPAIEALRARSGPFHGVLQMATAPVDGLIGGKSPETVARILRPKIDGTIALDEALANEPLDWFIACSSIAAWHGVAGGADYAYACAWQSHFAATRQAMVDQGQRQGRSLSIAWPQWRYDRHLSAGKLRLLERAGLAPLEADDGLKLIALALAAPSTDVCVLKAAETPLRQIIAAYNAQAGEAAAPAIETELARLSDAELQAYVAYLQSETTPEPVPPTPNVAAGIIEIFCAYLKIDPSQIRPDSRFETFGLDSIKALHVAERLSRKLNVPVDPAMFYEHPTIALLAAAIEGQSMLQAGQ